MLRISIVTPSFHKRGHSAASFPPSQYLPIAPGTPPHERNALMQDFESCATTAALRLAPSSAGCLERGPSGAQL